MENDKEFYPSYHYKCLCKTKQEALLVNEMFENPNHLAYQITDEIVKKGLYYEVTGYSDLEIGELLSYFDNLSYITFNYSYVFDNLNK